MLGPKKSAPSQTDIEEELPIEKKPLGKLGVALLVSLSWLAVLSIFILFVMNDPTEDRTVRNWLLLRLDPESETREQAIADEIFDLQDEWRELEAERAEFELEMDEERDALLLREEELDDREEALDDWEMRLEDRRDNLTEGGSLTPDIQHAAKTIERTEPAVAALALQEMDFDGALWIVSLIAPKRLAPIFDAMDPEFLVELLEAMSEPPDDDDDWGGWDDEW
jgi:flagellar motility protein MotE (MotC chaperone)